MRKIFLMLCISLILIYPSNIYAQENNSTFVDESLRDISIVAGLGVGGAILGLSTLSFVEEPSEHLKNIVVGAAIGIILGVGVVAYSQANKSKQWIDQGASIDFTTRDRLNWHALNSNSNHGPGAKVVTQFGHTFSF